ncbi:3-(3-hydroxy-phenyl)propionate transporter MhpT [Peristeroidobacter agariperforans]|uniref:3-(3-hydroxy-phenyl)propionate transporter MhpT n=1 Tax=Peristeroidobacter agariperforans TaxID=268404 RepID=UPI00101CFC60|nr:3-(3-hydroxy-phenyl)propionate transporter MhpT [Peristeroidobacter agariperforans]
MVQERTALVETPNVAITVALCFLVAVVEGFDIQAMGVAAPKLAPQFGFDPKQMGWIFSISNIGLVIGAGLGGRLADRVGRKPVFIGAVLAFGLFTLLTSLVGTFEALFVVRFCAGLGFGAALPNMMALAAEVSAPEKRASTAALMFAGMPLGGGTSALLTQLLPSGFDWRILFEIGGILPLLLAPTIYFLMPETLQKSAAGAPRTDIRSALFANGRLPATLLLWLAFLPTLLILYLILNWLPTLVVANGLDRAVAPQASLAFNFASVAGALVFGHLVDRMDTRWPMTFAYLGLIVALVALSRSTGLTMTVALSGAAGFFLLGANYALYGVAATYYPLAVRGTGSGASVAVGRIGSIIGPLLAGVLLGGGTSASGVVQYMVPVAAVAGAAVFALSFCRRPQE